MKYCDYIPAISVDMASEALQQHGTVLSAGGTDLIGVLKDRLLPEYPERIVSIKGLKGLEYIREKADGLHIGANTTLHDVAASKAVLAKAPALAQAAESVATPNIRSTATIAGNICQDIRCWYYRYPDNIGGRIDCARKSGHLCYAMMGENRYHSIFGAMKVCKTPCTGECPAGTDIPAYMTQLRAGNWDAAANIILQVNPMPMLTSRVCPHPCQKGCNQNEYGDSVNIHCVERSLGDYILQNMDRFYQPPVQETGKTVAIIGAGPSGLAAAYYLRKAGHSVTVYERMEQAGGVLRYGIPAYRLPKHYVKSFQDALEQMGVAFRFGVHVGVDVSVEELEASHDAMYIVTGAWKQPVLGLEGESLTQFGLDFLVEVNRYLKGKTGKQVLVCGGGNVAMDVALVSRRLGVEKVQLVCLEQRDEMPASPEEIARVLEEGVEFINGRGLLEVLYDENGKVRGMKTNRCLSVRDASGRFNPTYDNDDILTLESDCIILATGQRVDLDFLGEQFRDQIKSPRGLIEVDENNATRKPGVFAGGDVATGPNIAIRAVRAGGNAARAISAYLGFPMPVERSHEQFLTTCVEGTHVHEANRLWERPVDQRSLTDEDEASYPPEKLQGEINRCMNCGCLAVNSSDVATALVALNARIQTNLRTVSAQELLATRTRVSDMLTRGEIVTEIVVPYLPDGTVSAYNKYRLRKSIDFAIVAVASAYTLKNGVIQNASLVLGACAPIPYRAVEAEQYLIGKKPSPEVAAAAAELALAHAQPLERNAYKIEMAKTMVADSLSF